MKNIAIYICLFTKQFIIVCVTVKYCLNLLRVTENNVRGITFRVFAVMQYLLGKYYDFAQSTCFCSSLNIFNLCSLE